MEGDDGVLSSAPAQPSEGWAPPLEVATKVSQATYRADADVGTRCASKEEETEQRTRKTRWVVEGLMCREECEELLYLHRSNGVAGYRDRFSVTTLREPLTHPHHWGHLLPLLRLRDRLRNVVEELTGEHFGLFVEWTGISCWHTGSSIPPHYDSNRPYLQQRHYSVVLYLNEAGRDFDGGTFQFFDEEGRVEEEVYAAPGRVLIFSSGPENVHGVTPITRGERYTFTIWLTRNEEACEDSKILSVLPPAIMSFQTITPPRAPLILDMDCSEQSTSSALELKSQDDPFDMEAELLSKLELEVLSNTLDSNKKRKRREAIDQQQHDHPKSFSIEPSDQVVAKWRNVVIPYPFRSVRQAIELVSFATWKLWDPNSINANVESNRNEWWQQRIDEWYSYRVRLDEVLRQGLPEWKSSGCLFIPT